MSEEIAAWVNWNPDSAVHAFGEGMGRGRVVALCGIQVRTLVGAFDPDHPRSCEDCTRHLAAGRTRADVRALPPRPIGPNTFVCTRGDIRG